MRRRELWRIGVLAAAIAAFVAGAMARGAGPDQAAPGPEASPFTEAPAGESPAIAALIDRARGALESGRTPSQLLTDPVWMPAHEHPRFRRLIQGAALAAPLSMVTPSEPGVRLVVRGVVRTRAGAAASDLLLYAYHTSAKGWYSDRAAHFWSGEGDIGHARLFGYLRTDRSGRFEIRTIRPASYPRSDLPAHIHLHLQPAHDGDASFTEILFDDDPLLTAEARREATGMGFAICKPTAAADGSLAAEVELIQR
jgi:hypothetical protein